MRARIVRIGNSQGVRLSKLLLEQAGLTDEVELTAKAGQIVIAAARVARAGWADAARRLHAVAEDQIGLPDGTRFDDSEWEWR
ncbi:MAG: AbrB/MazE/SpoVT family DNA-binding domain-containing protein [bacterium]